MLTSTTLLKLLKVITSNRVQPIKLVDFLQKMGPVVTLMPCRRKFIRRKWSFPNESVTNNAFCRASDGSKKVSGSLS